MLNLEYKLPRAISSCWIIFNLKKCLVCISFTYDIAGGYQLGAWAEHEAYHTDHATFTTMTGILAAINLSISRSVSQQLTSQITNQSINLSMAGLLLLC